MVEFKERLKKKEREWPLSLASLHFLRCYGRFIRAFRLAIVRAVELNLLCFHKPEWFTSQVVNGVI